MFLSNPRIYSRPIQQINQAASNIFARLFGALDGVFFPENETVYEITAAPHSEEVFKLYFHLIDCRVNSREGGKKIIAACLFDPVTNRIVSNSVHLKCEIRMDKPNTYLIKVVTELSVLKIETQILGATGASTCTEYLVAA